MYLKPGSRVALRLREPGVSRVRQVAGRPGMESSIEPGEPFNHATPINRGAARGAPNETLRGSRTKKKKKSARDTISDS